MQENKKPKTIILLDWGGTCINPKYESRIFNQVLEHMEKTYPEIYPAQSLPRLNPENVFRGHMRKKMEETLRPEHVKIAQIQALALQRKMDNHSLDIDWLPKAKEALEKLSQDPDVVLAIASNLEYELLQTQLSAIGADRYVTIAEGHHPLTNDYKPESSDILRRALAKAGASKQDTILVVGDTKYDFLSRDVMRDYPHFFPVIIGADEVQNIAQEMTVTERNMLSSSDKLRQPFCADTFGYTPDLSGLEYVAKEAKLRADIKRSSVFKIDDFDYAFTAYQQAMSRENLPPRKGKLPEEIIAARLFSDLSSKEEHTSYHIAEKRREPNGRSVTEREQIDNALPLMEKLLDEGDFTKEMLKKIKQSKPKTGENITIFYPWRFEDPAAGISNTNIIPLIFSTLLADRLQEAVSQDETLKDLSLNISARELYHRTKNQRKDLTPFQKLAARSFFEIPPATGKAIVIDDNTISGMSLAEMCHSIKNSQAELIAVGITSTYDGADRFQIHPTVKEGLIEAIHSNVPHNGAKAVQDFENVLKRIGYADGIASMTNMEALLLVTRLYEPEKALEKTKLLWEAYYPEPLEAINNKMKNLGFPIWNGMLGKEGDGIKESEHILVRSCELGKVDLYTELRGLIDFCQQRGEHMLKNTRGTQR